MPYAPLRPCPTHGCRELVASGRCATHGKQHEKTIRAESFTWRRWYNTERWKQLRREVVADAAFRCAECGDQAERMECDHVVPHRGDPVLFWDRRNLSALCKSCHSRKTQAGQ